uniref:Uncharacterized protein n=1 Tax=Anguilla anguilla TaxID=7936 RepID=A0A0E9XPT1_ANGAN
MKVYQTCGILHYLPLDITALIRYHLCYNNSEYLVREYSGQTAFPPVSALPVFTSITVPHLTVTRNHVILQALLQPAFCLLPYIYISCFVAVFFVSSFWWCLI